MEKLDRYLDQVCRGIGGPRTLRQHIRLELRAHLLDAMAEHQAAGMTADDALTRALDDFGGPEQVRSEFEAMHGHRLMTLVVDKAIEWKERTMKAKWLWVSWAHLALTGIIAAEAAFLWWLMVLVMPAYVKFRDEGWLEGTPGNQAFVSWTHSFLVGMIRTSNIIVHYWWLWTIVLAAVWGLFEWRVRSENKPLMRLSALASAALGMMAPVALTALALIIQFGIALTTMHARTPEIEVRKEFATLEQTMPALQAAMAKKDWNAIREQSNLLSGSISRLSWMGAAAPTLLSLDQQPKVEQLRAQLKSANDWLRDTYRAIDQKDMARLETSLQRFRDVYDQIPKTGKKPGP